MSFKELSIKSLFNAITNNDLEQVKSLFNDGADIEARNNYLETPLITASHSNCPKIVNFLLSQDANVNAVDHEANSALHYSMLHKNPAITKALLKAGASANLSNNNGSTPLHWATYYDKLEQCCLLADHGADLNIQNDDHYTVLHVLAEFGNFAILPKRKSILTIIKTFLQRDVDLTLTNDEGKTFIEIFKHSWRDQPNEVQIMEEMVSAKLEQNILSSCIHGNNLNTGTVQF